MYVYDLHTVPPNILAIAVVSAYLESLLLIPTNNHDLDDKRLVTSYHHHHIHRHHHASYHCPLVSLHACSPVVVGDIHGHLLVVTV